MKNPDQDRLSAEVLLGNAGWMQSMARSLVQGPEQAEDVLQQSWLGILENPPRQLAHVRGWLRQVVQNQARKMGRGEVRRAMRERERVPLGALPSSEELALTAETQREVVSAILELKEPYRSTVLLRFYHDLSPAEIAEREGIPGATVRGRLKRALALLREKLDAQYGERKAWSSALMPMAKSAAVVLLSVQVKLMLGALGVALLAGVGWMLRPASSPSQGPALIQALKDPQESFSIEDGELVGQESMAPVSGEQVQDRTALVDSGAHVGPHLRGSVSDQQGNPIPSATLAVYAPGTKGVPSAKPWREVLSDQDGNFELPYRQKWLGEDRFRVTASCAGFIEITHAVNPDQGPLKMKLYGACELYGAILDDETSGPLAGVRIQCERQETQTGAAGEFFFPKLPVGRKLVLKIQADDYARRKYECMLPFGPTQERVIRIKKGRELELRVTDLQNGDPLEGVRLSIEQMPFGQSDSDGLIKLRVLQDQSLNLSFQKQGYADFSWYPNARLLEGVDASKIPMRLLGWIEGALTDVEGTPLSGQRINNSSGGFNAPRSATTEAEKLQLGLPGHSYHGVGRSLRNGAVTAADGKFQVAVVPGPEPKTLTGGSGDHIRLSMPGLLVTAPGQRIWVEAVQGKGARVHGSVLRNKLPMKSGTVLAENLVGEIMGSARVADDGSYLIKNMTPGTAVLRYQNWGGDQNGPPIQEAFNIKAGDTLRRDLHWEFAFAQIKGLIQDSRGDAKARQVIVAQATENESVSYSVRSGQDGTFSIDVIPGETYTVSATAGTLMTSQSDVPAGAEDLVLAMPAAGRIRFSLLDSESRMPIGISGESWREGFSWRAEGEEEFQRYRDNKYRSPILEMTLPYEPDSARMDLSLHLTNQGYQRRLVRGLFVSPPGELSPVVEITLERGRSCALSLKGKGIFPSNGHALFLLHESQQAAVRGPFPEQGGPSNARINGICLWIIDQGLRSQMPGFDADGFALLRGLSPGRYSLRCYPDDILFEPASFELHASSPSGEESEAQRVEILWRLR